MAIEIEEITDKVKDNAPLLIAGAVGVALVIATASKNKNVQTETVITPVTEGSSYPTVDGNAEVIMSYTGNMIDAAKKEIVDNMEGFTSGLTEKMENVSGGLSGKLDEVSGGLSGKLDGFNTSLSDKMDSLSEGFDSGLNILNNHVTDIKEKIEENQNQTLSHLESIEQGQISIAESVHNASLPQPSSGGWSSGTTPNSNAPSISASAMNPSTAVSGSLAPIASMGNNAADAVLAALQGLGG